MYRRLIAFAIVLLSIFLSGIIIEKEDLNKEKYISVEIKGEVENPGVYELILGSTLEDLFKEAGLKSDADTSMYAYSEVLHNSQVIVIKKHKSDLISINTADLDQLITLPGIGKSIAQRIIDYRNLYGSFNYLEELKNVNGIGDGKFNKIKEYICL